VTTIVMLNRTATGAGTPVSAQSAPQSIQGTVTGTGAVTATIAIEVSNDLVNWFTMGQIILSGTTSSTDGFTGQAMWALMRANVTAISGTGATVNVVANL